MMTPADLREQIRACAALAAPMYRTVYAIGDTYPDAIAVREMWLGERYRLAGLVWAAIGLRDRRGRPLFSAATELARQAATGEITPDALVAAIDRLEALGPATNPAAAQGERL